MPTRKTVVGTDQPAYGPVVDLSSSKLTYLPDTLLSSAHITRLVLSFNNLYTLSPEIGKLTNLVHLDLAGNHLTTLPPEIGNLRKLQFLDLGVNKLTFLPPEIGQLANLVHLDVSRNQLTNLPPEIGHLTELQFLRLDDNELTSLPSEIGRLSKLEVLYIDRNQFTELPPEMGQLKSLSWLFLQRNGKVMRLPAQLSSLTNLRWLILGGTPLKQLPLTIEQMPRLTIEGWGRYQYAATVPTGAVKGLIEENIVYILLTYYFEQLKTERPEDYHRIADYRIDLIKPATYFPGTYYLVRYSVKPFLTKGSSWISQDIDADGWQNHVSFFCLVKEDGYYGLCRPWSGGG